MSPDFFWARLQRWIADGDPRGMLAVLAVLALGAGPWVFGILQMLILALGWGPC